MGAREPASSDRACELFNSAIVCNLEMSLWNVSTIGLEPIELPNWKGKSGKAGKAGGMGLQTKDYGAIDVLLHANDGFLVELEMI